jgi:hypothetical protein
MPHPQGLQSGLRTFQCFGVAKHPVGKHGGQMFGGCSGCHVDSHIPVCVVSQALGGAALQFVIEPQFFQVTIEQCVDAPMGCFLPNKALHFRRKPLAVGLWQIFQPGPNGVHEILLAYREAHGQGAEKCRAKRIATIPPDGEGRSEVN